MIYGFYISLDPINFFSVGQCLLNAILPKDEFIRHCNIQGEWPVFGLPRRIVMDNAKEFRSVALQKFCQEYRIEDMYRPVARPEFGGAIERVIGTHMKQVHELPGTTFSNVRQRGTYESEKYATMTISELEQWYLDFVINVYHKTEHRSIGMTPEEKFYQGLLGVGDGTIPFLPSVPANTIKLRMALLPAFERTVQKNGITIDYITYFSETLRKWIIPAQYKKINKTLQPKSLICRRDPRDVSKLYVYDPDVDDYIIVPYSDIKRPAINVAELRQAIADARKEITGRELEMHDIFRAYERLSGYVEKAKREKRTTLRHNSSKTHTQKAMAYEKSILVTDQTVTSIPSNILPTNNDEDDGFDYYPVDE
jgi:putative transposase